MQRLAGKVAIITGGARGIGEGIVRRFVAEGATVVIADVLDDLGETLAKELGAKACFMHHDVTSREGWTKLIKSTEERFGRVDSLVNNAGVLFFAGFEDLTDHQIQTLINVNLIGVILGCQEVIPALERAGGGTIVNMSSADGLSGANAVSVYCSTKFAVRGLTKSLALELGPRKIRVNSIHPGGIYTPLANPGGYTKEQCDSNFWIYPAQRMGEASDIGAAAAYLASDDAAYCMGTELAVDGGLSAGHYYMGFPGAPTNPAAD